MGRREVTALCMPNRRFGSTHLRPGNTGRCADEASAWITTSPWRLKRIPSAVGSIAVLGRALRSQPSSYAMPTGRIDRGPNCCVGCSKGLRPGPRPAAEPLHCAASARWRSKPVVMRSQRNGMTLKCRRATAMRTPAACQTVHSVRRTLARSMPPATDATTCRWQCMRCFRCAMALPRWASCSWPGRAAVRGMRPLAEESTVDSAVSA